MRQTKVAMATSFTQELDWIDGAVMGLLLLRWLQNYRNLNALWQHLHKNYPDLVELTGMRAYPMALARAESRRKRSSG